MPMARKATPGLDSILNVLPLSLLAMKPRFPPELGCPPAASLAGVDLEVSIGMKSGRNEAALAQIHWPLAQ